MKSNFPKIQLLLSVVFLLLVSFIFWYFYTGINKNNREAQSAEIEWRQETARREEIKSLDKSIKAIASERAELDTHFARSSDIVPFLDIVEALAVRTGAEAEISSVDILPEKFGLLVGLKATGSFSSLYKFIALLENSSYELEFVSMDLSKIGGGESGKSGVPSWAGNFKIKLLSFVE